MILRRLAHARTRMSLAAALLGAGISACADLGTLNVATEDPIAVDIKMRIDVYQHGSAEDGADHDRAAAAEHAAVVERQRNRMEEIQELKNNRFVGESHRGLLAVREAPAGEYGEYVENAVAAENEDRSFLMRQEARERGITAAEVAEEQWRARVKDAFEGEWIETPGTQPGSYEWVQKR